MGRKNRDLFEILGARKGSAGLVQRVQDFVAPPPKKAGKSKAGKKSATRGKKGAAAGLPSTAGVVLGAVAFACLLVGFMVGRWSVDTSGPQPDLNASAKKGSGEGREGFVSPGRIGLGTLSDEKLRERLSNFGFTLLPFPIPDEEGGAQQSFGDAKRLALWFRDQGFSSVRIRRMKNARRSFWVVVDYVDTAHEPVEYERLSSLDSPDFAPQTGAWIAKHPAVEEFQ